jgi:N-carbamoylputrescine amidase
MSRALSLAICQVSGPPYARDRNRRASVEAAERAFERGADVVVLPELIVPGYGADRDQLLELAEPLDGPTISAWTGIAARNGGYIAGGFCERHGGSLFNSAVIVGPDGLLLHYRKLHLFSEEKNAFEPGDLGFPVIDSPLGRIGVCVCYDLRFVETVRILALRGAQLVLVPTAWVGGFDTEPNDENGVARQAHAAAVQANLSQVFIACASQAGTFGATTFLGSSVVLDPTGAIVAGPLPGDRDETAIVRIDLGDADRAQNRSDLIRPREDRRTDVYRVAVDGELL